jgi:hypothetical protein
MIELYQVIAILLGLIAILYSILRFRDGKMSIGMLLLWIFIWLVIIIISLYPNDTNYLANYTGIGRGLDFVLIIGILLSFYLIFKMYNKIESIEEELTDLVRELAIQNKNTGIKEDEKIQNESDIENLEK